MKGTGEVVMALFAGERAQIGDIELPLARRQARPLSVTRSAGSWPAPTAADRAAPGTPRSS